MATAAPESDLIDSFVDTLLVKSVMKSVESAMSMCNQKTRCVGVASVPAQEVGLITGMIGVHGKVSGFITVNMSDRVAIKAVEGLLQESYGELTSQVVDGAGEITNIICGGVKSALTASEWAFSHMTVPSVIVGKGYQIAYARGLHFACATFEHENEDAIMLEDRLLRVSMSLLRL